MSETSPDIPVMVQRHFERRGLGQREGSAGCSKERAGCSVSAPQASVRPLPPPSTGVFMSERAGPCMAHVQLRDY